METLFISARIDLPFNSFGEIKYDKFKMKLSSIMYYINEACPCRSVFACVSLGVYLPLNCVVGV